MLANNWSPPPLCLLALEATEPAEEAIKRSIASYKLNNKFGSCAHGAWTVVMIHDETSINDDVKIKWRKCIKVYGS